MSDDLAARAAAAGMRLVPLRKLREPTAQLVHALHHHEVDAVIDGGANLGQFARGLRLGGWEGPILSIEPDPEIHAELISAARDDPDWHVLPPLALGDRCGSAVFQRSVESDMSSLLPQTERLRAVSPTSRVLEKMPILLRRLDRLSTILDAPWHRLFVKLDLQGGEAAALDGAAGLMDRIVGLQVEMALIEAYCGERPWLETIAWAAARGFTVHLLLPGYFERRLARQLQVDGVFFREPTAPPMR